MIDHHEDKILLLKVIDNFIDVIIFVNENINNSKIKDMIFGRKPIYETLKLIGVGDNTTLSKLFIEIFKIEDKKEKEEEEIEDEEKKNKKDKENLTINKITNLFVFYLKLIFEMKLKEDFKQYQVSIENTENIEAYFKEDKDYIINKEKFKKAIILFISLYLIKQKDKVNKIKNNKNNIVNYLDIKDLWLDVAMNKKEFKQELKILKI